jgi:hypothetical protein
MGPYRACLAFQNSILFGQSVEYIFGLFALAYFAYFEKQN